MQSSLRGLVQGRIWTRVHITMAPRLVVVFALGGIAGVGLGFRLRLLMTRRKAGMEPNYLFDIVRDFGFFVLGVLVAWFAPGRFALDSALGLVPGQESYGHIEDDEEEPDEKENH